MVDKSGLGLEQGHERVFAEIKTREQALTYVEDLVHQVDVARVVMDRANMVATKKKAFYNVLMRYGRALGSLSTLVHVRILEDADYNRFAPRLSGAIEPRVIATIGS
jgi:hypothetical protein